MSDIKIFVSHRTDLQSQLVENPFIYNVRCGAALEKKQSNIYGDDTGDNISSRKNTFCELTVHYWAWKNMKADYYGLFHYRRYFSFSDKHLSTDEWSNVSLNYIDEKSIKMLGLTPEQMQSKIEQYDILVGEPFVGKSVLTQFESTLYLHVEDLQLSMDIVKKLYPDYDSAVEKYINGKKFHPCNMFIMKKEAFLNYSEWLFSILFELEKQLDISNYGIEGCRTLAHIAERLLGVYYTYQMSKGTYRLGELQHAIFWNPQKTLLLFPAFERNNISIVMACSDYYIPYAAVTLESIVQTSDLQNNYDIVLLNTYLSDKSKKIFEKVIENCSNFSIRYYDVGELISSHRFIANNHVSVETFYRLFVQKIFVNYEKILYLDSDLIVKCDIAQLYNIDIGSNLLAATRDADFISQYCGAVKKVKKYTDTILKLDDPYSYFQAGVIVFNIKEMNLSFKNESLVEFGSKQEYMYVDQDVLNSKCQGRVYYLDMAWNVFSTCGGARMTNIKTFAPLRIYEEYLCARKHPKIIHYAGYLKPWNDPMEDFALEFWATIKESFLYEIILSRMSADVAWHTAADYENYQKNFHQSSLFLRKAKMRIKKIVAVFFPVGTNRRDVMKRFYFRFRGWNISN